VVEMRIDKIKVVNHTDEGITARITINIKLCERTIPPYDYTKIINLFEERNAEVEMVVEIESEKEGEE